MKVNTKADRINFLEMKEEYVLTLSLIINFFLLLLLV
jgi:hypothetical protein